MLKDSHLAVSEIAMMLDYADARSFTRAFRRWRDATPARWRAVQKRLRRAKGRSCSVDPVVPQAWRSELITAGLTTWIGCPAAKALIWSNPSANCSSYSSRVT